jgi:Leucine-rich repeat (LRR) protein
MSNAINNKVPSLSIQASSCVLNHLEESIHGKEGNRDLLLWGIERKEACKAGLMWFWENWLLHPDQHPYLKLTMEKIQDLVIKEALFQKFQCTCAIFDPLKVDPRNAISLIKKSFVEACLSDGTTPDTLLQENGVQLFQKLAGAFGLQSLSTDFNVYKPFCDEQDEALKLIWSDPISGIAAKLGVHAPQLKTASQIREWMADPKNMQVLSRITTLTFIDCELKVIPLEILSLPNLIRLCLINCEIKVIPKEIATSQLTELNLNDNQIKMIPEELAKSQLTELYLSYNQIKMIPEELAKSQLTELYLSYNQIKMIPEELAKSQLKTLYLCYNQIKMIPKELAKSQLTELNLSYNQIKVIPEELAKSQLKLFFLHNNPLLFISYDRLCSSDDIFIKNANFNSYNCLSDFSKLLKTCSSEILDIEAIKAAFARLKYSDQCLIFEMVYLEACRNGVGIASWDLQWGEHHVFDDMDRFCMALRRAVVIKFNRLSSEQKNRVYAESYNLTYGAGWRELYAQLDALGQFKAEIDAVEGCIPRLIDAMELAGF